MNNELLKAITEINKAIMLSITNVGLFNTCEEFHTIIFKNLSNQTCEDLESYYKSTGWKYAKCENSITINENTKDEFNPDRKFNRTGILLKYKNL